MITRLGANDTKVDRSENEHAGDGIEHGQCHYAAPE